MATMNISLPDQLRAFVDQQVATGRFANASDYVRDLIRDDQERAKGLAELQELIREGIESGVSDKSIEQIFAEARASALKELERDGAAHESAR
jgi:antitoxin ParD1/3/4